MTARIPPHLHKNVKWPAMRVQQLEVLFHRGLSHLLIARALGISRSSVSSKIARMGWTREETVERAQRPKAPPRPQPIRTSTVRRRPVINGQALLMGGNRADRLLRRFSWETEA